MNMVSQPIRLTVLAMSPAYYHVPLYRLLAQDPRFDFSAVFTSSKGLGAWGRDFGQPTPWDIDLLSGYKSIFLDNPLDEPRGIISNFRTFTRNLLVDTEVLWLHGYNHIAHQVAAFSQIVQRKPLLIREEATLLTPRPLWKRTLKSIPLRTLLHPAHGLYIGSNNRTWFRHYGVPSNRLHFVPYTVDNDRFQDDARYLQRRRDAIRTEFGICKDNGPVIATVCRLVPKKQVMKLLEAFRELRALEKCTLLISGTGSEEFHLREYIDKHAIPDVTLTGFINQSSISHVYAAADIFVLASGYDETWGLAVNEAMNFGLPIVVSNQVGSGADLVQDGRNGFIFDAASTQQLASCLHRLVESESLRQSFGARSLEIIDKWTYRAAYSGIVEATKSVAGPSRWRAAEMN